jgi:O-antigen chain-terminating methyltransferase
MENGTSFLEKKDEFYKCFEDRYRGNQETIKERLEVYLPYIIPLNPDKGLAVDLGCGRGEWLELLKANGFNGVGVDLDKNMLQAADERGLHTYESDALSYLKSLEDESCIVISGFHIVEHLPFDTLLELVYEAFRVLTPGGILILETPNVENIITATSNFYIDPTHIRPVPNKLLKFIAEYMGFYNTVILRLQSDLKDNVDQTDISMSNIFFSVSQDYGLIARKEEKISNNEFLKLFSSKKGYSLEDMIILYQENVEQSRRIEINELNKRIYELENLWINKSLSIMKNIIHKLLKK